MADKKAKNGGPFWTSRKFWMQLVAAAVFVALALTETVTFTSDQVLMFVLVLAGIATGAHAATDIAAIIGAALTNRGLGRGDGPSGPGDSLLTPEAIESITAVAAELGARRALDESAGLGGLGRGDEPPADDDDDESDEETKP